MSEIYKIKKKALVRGAGDLATGVGVALHRAEFQVIMTDIAVPLTVRREVAMSRAVYEGRVEVEGIEGILVKNYREARQVLEEGKIAVIVDPEGIQTGCTCGCNPCKTKYWDQPDGCTICDRPGAWIYRRKGCPCCDRDDARDDACRYYL